MVNTRRPSDCPFCHIDDNHKCFQDDLVFTIKDGFPISPGHTLIIPKRHIPIHLC
ncbi:MAG: hypothetical protein DRR08_03505 [Candidatus Parabeggiatoa sp. nov. 2]|nr:MAG: hypothetical protein B6247_14135 [Beggiatoa sp. 4572_84]RKZ63409.1 MAG: hypothetical protein DRR08_03505 [Gammaproteobacteria bacterium]